MQTEAVMSHSASFTVIEHFLSQVAGKRAKASTTFTCSQHSNLRRQFSQRRFQQISFQQPLWPCAIGWATVLTAEGIPLPPHVCRDGEGGNGGGGGNRGGATLSSFQYQTSARHQSCTTFLCRPSTGGCLGGGPLQTGSPRRPAWLDNLERLMPAMPGKMTNEMYNLTHRNPMRYTHFYYLTEKACPTSGSGDIGYRCWYLCKHVDYRWNAKRDCWILGTY